ncbi:MAG: glycosyltransferase [Bacteroidales bacterium]|nr:glycosyltransferase [Bacteroidales bacterium]
MKAVISILVWDSFTYINNLLENLNEINPSKRDYKVIVLDQGSSERVRSLYNYYEIDLIQLNRNIGFAAGHNKVYAYAKSKYSFKYFIILNSDSIFTEKKWLDTLTEPIKNGDYDITGTIGLKITKSTDGRLADDNKFDFLSGSLLAIKKEVIEEIGLFDEVYTPAYFEDADFILRAKLNKYRIGHIEVGYRHAYIKNESSTSDEKKGILFNKYGDFWKRNQRIFCKRWLWRNFMRSHTKYPFKDVIIYYSGLKKLILILKNRNNRYSNQNIFRNAFISNKWGDAESHSGPGSNLEQTDNIRKEILDLIKEYNIHSILDAPCGDFFWMKEIKNELFKLIDNYVGIDIVSEIIDKNKEKYEDDKFKFSRADIQFDYLPKKDLVICRDLFLHISFEDITKVLQNFKKSRSKYLIVSTNTFDRKNKNILNISLKGRSVNLSTWPFNLKNELLIINENCSEQKGKFKDKSLILYQLKKINITRIKRCVTLHNCFIQPKIILLRNYKRFF